MFSSSIRTIVCDSCLAITEKCIGLKLAPESQQPSHSGSHAPRTVRFVDLSPDSTIPSPSPSSSSLAPSLLSSSSSSLASYKSSSSKSPDPQEKRSLEKEKEKKLLKREQAPPKKGVKKAPTSSKKEGGKWKIGVKDQKKKIVELKEKKKKKKPGVSKVRDRDDIRNISNIGCSARATDLDMCEDGVRAPSLSLSPVPGAQARIGKRNRDCWSSDSECSGDSGIQ